MTGQPRSEAFTLRQRPASEKLLDQGFKHLTFVLAEIGRAHV